MKNLGGSFHVKLGSLLRFSGCTLWGQEFRYALIEYLFPLTYGDFDQFEQVSVFIMFLWRAQGALRSEMGTPNTRLSTTLWI